VKIIKASITCNKNIFVPLELEAAGPDYEIEHTLFSFQFFDGNEFIIENLKEILKDLKPPCEIGGKIKCVDWVSVLEEINKNLRFTYADDLRRLPNTYFYLNEAKWQERKKIYWQQVQKFIALPPEKCYVHIPLTKNDHCSDFIQWRFCYILLSQEKGVLLHSSASD